MLLTPRIPARNGRWQLGIHGMRMWRKMTSEPNPVPWYGRWSGLSSDGTIRHTGFYAFPFALRIATWVGEGQTDFTMTRMEVVVQENGIIRAASNGLYLGRLAPEVPYGEMAYLYGDLRPELHSTEEKAKSTQRENERLRLENDELRLRNIICCESSNQEKVVEAQNKLFELLEARQALEGGEK